MLKNALSLVLLAAALGVSMALAGDRMEPYDSGRLDALQAEGRPVLVEVYADWCSTCKRQSPILSRLLAEDEFSNYGALKLDWDRQRDEARALGAPRQSTLFLFQEGERIAMVVAETDEQRLREFLTAALN